MLASAVFFYGSGSDGNESPASLFDAYDLIGDSVGKREPEEGCSK
jgi:metal iron transporter